MSANCVKIEPKTEIDQLLYKTYTTETRKGYVEVGEDKIIMPEYYSVFADEIENFQVRDSDVWVTSHPKTGTTWTMEMVWLIVNNLNFDDSKREIYERVPFLEFSCVFDYRDKCFEEARKNSPQLLINSVETAKNAASPRVIKTHLPFSLLPKQIKNKSKKPKIIHVIRDVKDTCNSFYHHSRLLEGYKGTFEEYCKLFIAGKIFWGPFFKNVLSFWSNREEYNILFIRYEDLKHDLKAEIRKVAHFLNKPITEEQLGKLEQHLSFESMKNNRAVNHEQYSEILGKKHNVQGHFMRKGIVGSHKEEMSQQLIEMFDEWSKESLKETGLTLNY